jgi:hypothetical protein
MPSRDLTRRIGTAQRLSARSEPAVFSGGYGGRSLAGYVIFGVCATLGLVMIAHWGYRRFAARKNQHGRRY